MELKNEKNIVIAEKYLYALQLKYFQNLLTAKAPQARETCRARLEELKELSSMLSNTYSYSKGKINTTVRIDRSAVKDFEKAVASSHDGFIKNIGTTIKTECPFILGYTAHSLTKNNIEKIRRVDPKLVPSNIPAEIAPSAFGATINGFTTLDNILDVARNDIDNPEEQRKNSTMDKIPGIVLNAAAFPSTAANAVKHKLTGNKRVMDKVKARAAALLVVVGMSAATIGGINGIANQVKTVENFNHLSQTTNHQNGYEVNVRSATRTALNEMTADLAVYDESNLPSRDELLELTRGMDGLIDDVVEDLVVKAYQEQYPDYTVTNVETSFDDTINMHNNSDPHPDRFIHVTYKDQNGKEQTVRIDNQQFSSYFGVWQDPLSQSFEDERKIDLELYSRIYSVYSENYSGTEEEKTTEIMSIVSDLKDINENTNHLAGTEFELHNSFMRGTNIKVVLPDELGDER